MSDLFQSLSHSRWDCKYHVVFVPKRRRKVLFGKTRRHLGEIFHALARQKECEILDGHLMPDHVHTLARGVESATGRRKYGEAMRGDGEVSEKSPGKRVKVPVDSIQKAHT
jgi:hypothetical protein